MIAGNAEQTAIDQAVGSPGAVPPLPLPAWNATDLPFPEECCIHDLVAAQAARTPDAVALIWGDEYLSYAALERRVNRLAHRLRREGVGPETCVGVCVARTPLMLIGLLAILKAGGSYVPLDPAYPPARLAQIRVDACPLLVLTDESTAAAQEQAASATPHLRICLAELAVEDDRAPLSAVLPANLAYLIYTSGSTGRPKGVAITHRSAVAFISWAQQLFRREELRGVLAGTSICFDLSVFELFVTLSSGGTVILAEQVLQLPQLPAASATTLINSVPSAVTTLLRINGLPATVRTVNLAGEPLPLRLVQQLYQQPGVERVLNLYGPSEDTTYSTCATLPSDIATIPSIGYPIANTQVYLLDAQLQPVPIGEPGELYLGGAGLARGYFNRPDLTAERFVPNPFAHHSSARLYKTGDLARYRPDGNIEFLGRIDQQVKIRGFRIELGEIETVLARHPAVRDVVVLAREDIPGEQRLVAYLVLTSDEQPQATPAAVQSELRAFLAAHLPDYMLPSAFVLLDALPLSPNGKIDRKALPAPPQMAAAPNYVPPRTPLETTLAQIWAEVLGYTPVGVEDNFFALGGHSLHATQVISRLRQLLQVELQMQHLFALPSVARLAAYIENSAAQHNGTAPLIHLPMSTSFPISFAQQRVWLLDQLAPKHPAYNIPIAFRLRGTLDHALLEQSLNAIVQRHAALRTSIITSDGQPLQVIAEHCPLPLPLVDLSEHPVAEREDAALQFAQSAARQSFDIAHALLLRALLLRLEASEHLLVLVIHHIVADDWSLGVLFRELGQFYAAGVLGHAAQLPELPIQYADFAVWQQQWLQGEVLAEQLNYWRQQLAHAPALLELPSDYPRPPVQSLQGALYLFSLPAPLLPALHELSQREGVTLFMTLLTAFQVLLLRYSGQDDIVVGSPIANRNRREIEELIGFFVNTLVLRSDLSGNPPFREALQRVREVCLGAYAHQDLPFERLVEELRPQRDLSYHALVQVMFTLQNAPMAPLELPGLTLTPLTIDNGTAKLDLSLFLEETPQGLRGMVEYSTDLFAEASIARFVTHFQLLLEGVVADPQCRLGELPLLSPADVQQIVHGWAGPPPELPFQPVAARIAAQAARDPVALAIQSGTTQLSYAALDSAANQLAHALQSMGVGAECCVALCFERSPELVVAALAVLKAGGAFLPLDPAAPPARLSQLLNAARPSLLLSTAPLSAAPTDLPSLVVDLAVWQPFAHWPTHTPHVQPQPEQLAYLIYTSGSTGQPKAVMLTQRNLAALVAWHTAAFALGPHDRCTLLANPAFDASVWEIWPALAAGASLHLPDAETRLHATYLRDWLLAERISVSFVPTPLAEQLLTLPWPTTAALRLLLTGGDRLRQAPPPDLPFTLVNNYGPTEGTVLVTSGVIAPTTVAAPALPDIGTPITTAQLYVLDRFGQPVPQGVGGELYFGGLGLARGYLDRPDLTAEKFVPHPFATEPGARLYRSGDRVRWLADGRLDFVGRADDQVKIRGVRVEPSEVAALLGQHPQVQTALVLAQRGPSGDGQLLAYVVLHPSDQTSAPTPAGLRAYLKERLPDALVPSAVVLLEALPLTPNGKIDRKALPLPDQSEDLAANYVAPRSLVEQVLSDMWCEALHHERISIHANFFDVGGHSLNATQIVSRIRQAFQLDLTVRHLFETPTIATLAQRMVALEQQPGRTEKIARALQRIKAMSGSDIQKMVQAKRERAEQARNDS